LLSARAFVSEIDDGTVCRENIWFSSIIELLTSRTGVHFVVASKRQHYCQTTHLSLMSHHRFWFHDKDRNCQPIDTNVLKTAERIAPVLTRYRHQEIDSESTCNDMLQEAVEAASRATHRKQIANLAGYIASIYKHIVDKCLDRKNKLVAVDDDFLASLANAHPAPSFEEWMHNRLVLEKLIKSIDRETLQIWSWRIEGYSESEIANRLGITANAVSVRITRGIKQAAKDLIQGKRSRKRK
jgi:RNA polymerase sigma factor (sigma-70 family)